MQMVSTKTGKFHLFAGLRKVEVHFGEPIAPEKYLALPREEFQEFIRQRIAATQPTQPVTYSAVIKTAGLSPSNPPPVG
jgi:hypothetical protein